VAQDTRAGTTYGPHSATSLAAIRLRFNMNAVRVPVDAADTSQDRFFPELAKLLGRINDLEMLPILAAPRSDAVFWAGAAAQFRSRPNLMFDLSDSADPAAALRAVREAGALQPVILPANGAAVDDANAIYAITPDIVKVRSADGWEIMFG